MNVLQSLNNILYTLLSDAEARNFNPPVPATVVAEIETLIAHFRRHEQFRVLPGGTIFKMTEYKEHFDPSVDRIKWIKQCREHFRCSLKEAHDLSHARSAMMAVKFEDFIIANTNEATPVQMEEFERRSEFLGEAAEAVSVQRWEESRSAGPWNGIGF